MKRNLLVLLAPIACLASIANADLVSVGVVAGPFQHPDGQHETWRIIVQFDNEFDRLPAIAGLPIAPFNPIEFTSSSALYNQALFSGLPFNDFPSGALGGESYDTYVTIGAVNFPHNTLFTPGFIEKWYYVPPPVAIINGDHIGPIYDGAWYFFGEPPLVGQFDSIDDNETIDVVVAQFTLPTGSSFTFTGNVAWLDINGDLNITPFDVGVVPAPGAFALLTLAGLAVNRKRRK